MNDAQFQEVMEFALWYLKEECHEGCDVLDAQRHIDDTIESISAYFANKKTPVTDTQLKFVSDIRRQILVFCATHSNNPDKTQVVEQAKRMITEKDASGIFEDAVNWAVASLDSNVVAFPNIKKHPDTIEDFEMQVLVKDAFGGDFGVTKMRGQGFEGQPQSLHPVSFGKFSNIIAPHT